VKKGEKVIYNGEEYEIFFLYDSGYCEIKRLYRKNILLVHHTEIQKIHKFDHLKKLSPNNNYITKPHKC
jgi:hypothetical protein